MRTQNSQSSAGPRPSKSFDPFHPGVVGNIKNFKALFGDLPLEGTAEILRADLARYVAAGMVPEEAVAKRIEELDETTTILIKASQTVIADNMPKQVQRHILAMLHRDIERRIMLTGEHPAKEVRATHDALHDFFAQSQMPVLGYSA